nr:unnamed protein product [Digitaria exilis]
MADTVSSAVAQEAVHHVLSGLMERYEHSSDAKDLIERMEMAHIRLEAALEASQRWSITNEPLLRWRSKLKRATQECDHTLRRCRRRLQEEEEERSSLPSRVARAAMSLVSSIIGGDSDDKVGGSTVRRFERFADGASEFLRYVELGGSMPRRSVFFNGALPISVPDRGMEGYLIFSLEDGNMPENNFVLTLNLRVSESTDIVRIVVRCVELFAPHLSSTAEVVKTKLTQLPTQDLRWVPDAHSVFGHDGRWDNLDSVYSKWVRPNPLCCQQQHQSYITQSHPSVFAGSCHIAVL